MAKVDIFKIIIQTDTLQGWRVFFTYRSGSADINPGLHAYWPGFGYEVCTKIPLNICHSFMLVR